MKRVKKIIFIILSILLGLILIFNIYNFISLKVLHKDIASINGYAMLEVVSGSMEPTIYKGDMIIINTKAKNYKENDIITFRGKEGEFVTHRIKSIDNKTMITKGDNNNTEDAPIKESSIVGKYVAKIKNGGRILSSFKNPFTMAMIFIIGLLACILLSTDSNGLPLLDKEELEFQEFLKSKNEIKEEPKKVLSPKKDTKKTNATIKSDTKNKENKNTTKTVKKTTTKSSNKTVVKETKKVEAKASKVKKVVPKKETTKKKTSSKTASTKPTTKKTSSNNTKTAKKSTSNKSSKK